MNTSTLEKIDFKTVASVNMRGEKNIETMVTNLNGYDFQIHTSKRSNGQLACTAQPGTSTPATETSFSSFQFVMFQDRSITLNTEKLRATENNLMDVHKKGLEKFQELLDNDLLAKRELIQVEISAGMHFSDGRTSALNTILSIDENQLINFINRETLKRGFVKTKEILIKSNGYIFSEEPPFTSEQILELKSKEAEMNSHLIKQREENKALAEARISKGKELVVIPSNAAKVIVAEFHIDKSDPFTDYFAYTTDKTVLLAFSTHDQNNFSEMRKAASNAPAELYPEIVELATCDQSFENRENYSGGSGSYLGKSKYSGWIIKKTSLADNEIFGLAADNLCFANATSSHVTEVTSSSAIPENEIFKTSETVHAKNNYNLFVATIIHRVERPIYEQFNSIAKELGGWYSTYRGNGAIPGFQFKAEELRSEFINKALSIEI